MDQKLIRELAHYPPCVEASFYILFFLPFPYFDLSKNELHTLVPYRSKSKTFTQLQQ